MVRKTKIIATIGPASASEEILENLIDAGMNVARLNFSHGTHEQYQQRIQTIRKVAARLNKAVGILQDLQGPKIRVGKLETPLFLKANENVCLYANQIEVPSTELQVIPVDFREIFDAVHPGDKLLLDDGRLTFEVLSTHGLIVNAKVLIGGVLSSHKGINLPGVHLRIAGFTAKDEADLKFGIAQGVDAVAISFVRTVDDVKIVKNAIDKFSQNSQKPLLIAKIEKPEAMEQLTEILQVVDGVMVARGDLGVELPPERVPSLQKHIIKSANDHGKLVITATQMLESMTQNPLPTRAEASDVANAVFDGTDAVMLSAETASGDYPVASVTMMVRIIEEAEYHFLEWGSENNQKYHLEEADRNAIAHAAHELVTYASNVEAISVFTFKGRSAWIVSKVRPDKRILALTPETSTYYQLAFLWGVEPYLMQYIDSFDKMLIELDNFLIKSDIQTGKKVVLVCGYPVGNMQPPNMTLLHEVGLSKKSN